MIEAERLYKTYGSATAIEDVTFAVERGEILGLLGPNGAGKTTTMRILTGYLPASQGTARIAGFDIHEQSIAARQQLGYLPETPPLYPEMTVEGFLQFVARLKGVAAGDRVERVNSALRRCNLLDRRRTLIRKLSKGYRQRVGIAQAIVHDPPVLVLDEPTVGLDPRQIIDVRNLIKSLAGDHTIVLSTHILPEVSMTCSRVAIINRGRIVATDRPDRLMNQLIGGRHYDLDLEGDREESLHNEGQATGRAAGLVDRLRSLAAIQAIDCEISPNAAANRLRLRITATEPTIELGPSLATAVVETGLGLCELRRDRASLEDVFLQLTTEETTGTTAAQTDPKTPEAIETSGNETSSNETSDQT